MSNNEAISENNETIPVVQEMIRDIYETPASSGQTDIDNLAADELYIQQALALPDVSESTGVCEETVAHSPDPTSEELKEVLDSTVKRLAISQNNAEVPDDVEPGTRFSRTISVQQIQSIRNQIAQSTEEPKITPETATTTATSTTEKPKKKPHIMISYNRTSSEICQKIRKSLRDLKFKVWMDIYDMRGNIVDGMANAIENSYIVLICLSHRYETSPWCRREIEDIAEKNIKFIPCYMEEPFQLVNWLGLLIGRRLWIDFSVDQSYDNSFQNLLNEITAIEEEIFINPRETPPPTPGIIPPSTTTITLNPTVAPSADSIIRDFKTWVEQNQENLQRLHPHQSSQLIKTLIQASRTDNQIPNDNLIHQLLFTHSNHEQNNVFNRLSSNFSFIQSICIIIALWTARIIYKKT